MARRFVAALRAAGRSAKSIGRWAADHPTTAALFVAYLLLFGAVGFVQGGWRFDKPVGDPLALRGGALIEFGALVEGRVAAGEYWRLLTATLLHGGIVHLAFNSFALLQIGAWIEEWFGSAWLLCLHVGFGLVGNVVSLAWHHGERNFAQVGASGALYGMFCFIAIAVRHGHSPASMLAFRILILWLVFGLLFGAWMQADNAAHLGGAAAGAFVGLFEFSLRPGILPRWLRYALGTLSVGLLVISFAWQWRTTAEQRRQLQLVRERMLRTLSAPKTAPRSTPRNPPRLPGIYK